ncbi:MAG: prolyl oligopeptidase family serine peptidase [Acidobacteria bacterium]|nr:prolyl oligopeptidase family serine peptidase [Acidobacteriota bacterium]
MPWVKFVFACFLVVSGAALASSASKRPLAVQDCVRTRRVVGRELALSPDGNHVAFVVKAPDVRTNKNNYQVFVRDLRRRQHRENGRILVQSEFVSGLRWLADGIRVAILTREQGQNEIRIVNTLDGKSEVALRNSAQIEEFSISGNGNAIVFVTQFQARDLAARRNAELYGFPVVFGVPSSGPEPEFVLHATKRDTGNATWRSNEVKLTGLGMIKQSSTRRLHSLNLSPDGRQLLLVVMNDYLPPKWESNPLVQRFRELGSNPPLLALVDLATGDIRLAFNAPYRNGVTTWAGDSHAFAVQINSPIDSPEFQQEAESAIKSGEIGRVGHEAPLFVVNRGTMSFSRVLPKLPRVTVGGIPVSWERSDGPMLCRLRDNILVWMTPSGAAWVERSRTGFTLKGNNANYPTVADDRTVVGVSEDPTTPPDLFLYDIKSKSTTLLTDLNPELREVELGGVENLEWKNRYGAHANGFLIKPVGYRVGSRYPLVIITKFWTNSFICDTDYQTAFPPQPLANVGFAVLMAHDPINDRTSAEKLRLEGHPGEMSEAFNWMAMVESAIELLVNRGLVDIERVGLMGFSRTSWKTDFMLTHSDFRFAAASSADSGIYNYGSYWLSNQARTHSASELQMGGPPYGEAFKNWLAYSPAFNAGNVKVPLLMEYTREDANTVSVAHEFYTALRRQGKPAELYYYPLGSHILDKPLERIASLQRNVDWFRFWIQGYEGDTPEYDPEQYSRWRGLRRLTGQLRSR